MTSPKEIGFTSEEDLEEMEDALLFAFGLAGPLEWVADLNKRLAEPAARLASARYTYEDPKRDCTDEIDADAKAKIRIAVTGYLCAMFQMLSAMPAFQQQPHILEALKFIITEIASVEKGRSPNWLQADPSKRHFIPLTKEAEWVSIIAALELARLKSSIRSVDASARFIAAKTSRKVGTIKDWHRKFSNQGRAGTLLHPTKQRASESIRTVVNEMLAVLRIVQKPEERDRLLNRRIDELLHL